MKKLLFLLSTITIISCSEPGVHNATFNEKETYIQVDTNLYKVVYVTINTSGSGFYLMVPKDKKVTLPQSIGYTQGKTHETVIVVK